MVNELAVSMASCAQEIKGGFFFWDGDKSSDEHLLAAADVFNFDDYDSLELFRGTHPTVRNHAWRRRTGRYRLTSASSASTSHKYRLMYWVEKLTGNRFFEFRNFRLL